MAVTFGEWVANHRWKHVIVSEGVMPTRLASGLWVFNFVNLGDALLLPFTMRKSYSGQTLNFAVTWTVPSGVTGNLNIGGNFCRRIEGVWPALPESAGFGTGAQAAPTANLPKTSVMSVTQAGTAPLFPGGLGGVVAEDDCYLRMVRTGGTTLTGAAHVIAVEGYWN